MKETILLVLSIFFFFAKAWFEKDKEKKKEYNIVAKEMRHAFKEPDKKKRASRLNVLVDRISRL